jgi:AcrR family transcriptional regulator
LREPFGACLIALEGAMSKSATIDALMESAIYSFSRDGYEGASLRDIARSAEVPLSTIHLYFGSKAELFAAVGRRAWDEVDAERSSLLEAAMAKNPAMAALPDLIHAVAYPIVRRALGKSDRDIAQIYILRSHLAHWNPLPSGNMLELADRSMVRWINAMMACCPTLSRQDMIWSFSFVIGVVYSWQVIDRRYDSLLGRDNERSAEDVTADIVVFCRAGIEGIVRERATSDT